MDEADTDNIQKIPIPTWEEISPDKDPSYETTIPRWGDVQLDNDDGEYIA